MGKSAFLSPAPPEFKWPQCPEAERFIQGRTNAFLDGHAFARRLSERMREETSTEIQVWVDHLILPAREADIDDLKGCGFVKDNLGSLWHPFADLPRIRMSPKAKHLSCAVMVESVSDFLLAQDLSLPIEGAPLSAYRLVRIPGEKGELLILERRGSRTYTPGVKDTARRYLQGSELWTNRLRLFKTREQGMKHTLRLAQKLAKDFGTGAASWIFLEAERRYWQKKNRAGQVQKARQDKLGLGWANHDHHTFRSSRPVFPALIDILLTFGFKKRERYYAGAEAGWGAQIMEQPETRLVIFADVDLSQEDASVDFSRQALPELNKPGTVGLWCALHGESMLEAGMHHLEARFDFEHLKASLLKEGVNLMPPFSDFPHLRQAFTQGELWMVPAGRLRALIKSGRLSPEAGEKIKMNGAVGSHLENLQRRNGFKGFNQRGVSHIIRAVNPETQALSAPDGRA